jgi:RNA polymerase-binding protein DksA
MAPSLHSIGERICRMTQLNAQQHSELEQALVTGERDLLATIARLRGELATPPGSTGPDVRDQAEEGQLREGTAQELVELDRAEHQLGETSAALMRMRQGTYGECEACGMQIPFERLRARPTARLCVQHEEERERLAASGRGVA